MELGKFLNSKAKDKLIKNRVKEKKDIRLVGVMEDVIGRNEGG